MTQTRSTDIRTVDHGTHATPAAVFDIAAAEPWMERALCAQTDPEAFFPEKGDSTREAKAVCRSCDVRGDCLEYSLNHQERYGIWGGLSERERRKLIRKLHPDRPSERLNEGQAAEVVRRYTAGETRKHLAEVYSVPDYVIRDLIEDAGVEIRGPGRHPRRAREEPPWADSDEWQLGRHIENVNLPHTEQEQTA